jgi:hypothetical protein
MTEHIHKIRVIQAIINRAEKMMMKMVEALGTKTSRVLVVYILFSEV